MDRFDIQEAYGEYWKLVEPYVDEEGWADSNKTGLIDAYFESNTGNNIQFEKYPIRRWRPEVLKNK